MHHKRKTATRVPHGTLGPMGTAGLPTRRPEHFLNCSPPSPGGCGSGFKATGTDSTVPPPPSPVDLPHVARAGGGSGSLHFGAHRAPGRNCWCFFCSPKRGSRSFLRFFLFASAGFTQFFWFGFVRLSGLTQFSSGFSGRGPPTSSPSRSWRCR